MWQKALQRMKANSGMTTLEISKGSGIPEPTLEKLFAGSTKEPKLPTVLKLVNFLGYTLDDLCKDEDLIAEQAKLEHELKNILGQLNEEGISRWMDYAEYLLTKPECRNISRTRELIKHYNDE